MHDGLIPPGAIDALRSARAVAVLTGAGISAESGIPTFRDPSRGLWAKYDPTRLATPEAFAADPELVSRWYDWRRERVAACAPNPGHLALVELEARLTDSAGAFTLLTQNVDQLHHAAGSRNVHELHGTIWVWRCLSCGESLEDRSIPFDTHPPRCASCGGVRRPGVVWFGEALPQRELAAADAAARSCDLFLSIGTSSVVYPAAGLIHIAREHGAQTIEINADPTPISELVDWSIRGKSGEILPELLSRSGR